jgi:hypothetical protein
MAKKIFDIIPPTEKKPLKEKLKPRIETKSSLRGTPKKKRIFLRVLIFSLIILILVGVFGCSSFSKTEVIIWPEKDTLNLKETVTINSETNYLDFKTKILPGEVFEDRKSISQDFPSSGKTLSEEKASGIIRVYNNYHLTQTLVENTRFQPPLEKFQPSLGKEEAPWFRTTERITISPGSYKDVKVVADSPGEKYNIEPSNFSVPGLKGMPQYTLVYGESFEEFKGGVEGETPQVTQDDLDKARNILTEKIEKESRDFLKSITPTDFIFPDETISQEILEENCSAEAGEIAEFFNCQAEIKSQGFSFKKSDIESFAKNLISLNIPEDKKIQEESLEINYSTESIDLESGQIVLNLEIKANVYPNIDLAELRKALLGRSFKEAQTFLENQPQIIKIEVNSWPFWKKNIPENIEKVEIRLELD